jgi:hypothetical protein
MSLVVGLASTFRTRASLQVEILVLRHQLAVLQRSKRGRLSLRTVDRLLWAVFLRLWPEWRKALVIVKPDTVIGWHRRGFRLYWKWKSRRGRSGRPMTVREIRELIRDMSASNVLWGAPRLHGELLKLGIEVSQAAVATYMVKHRKRLRRHGGRFSRTMRRSWCRWTSSWYRRSVSESCTCSSSWLMNGGECCTST